MLPLSILRFHLMNANSSPATAVKLAPFRIGLATSRSYQHGPDSALAKLLNGSRANIEEHLKPQLIMAGMTLDAMQQLGLLD